jgi:tetratricopeptide (TPR) repeat protein
VSPKPTMHTLTKALPQHADSAAHAADAAFAQGPAGRDKLPGELQKQFDLLLGAFALVESGQDEQARQMLQGIGLQSPFLEWKVLLRGLIAYYQKDDARALENWQRLAPNRLPARLAAPFRFLLDKDFRAAQSSAAQAHLQYQAERLQSSGLVRSLRAIQGLLSNERQLPEAFRYAEALLDLLRREAPDLAPRLAWCFYWAVIHHGKPEDVRRYRRVFGAPADDPKLERLQALALEQRGQLAEAQEQWLLFEKSLASNPAWPAEQAAQARALLWCHMGHNAEEAPNLDDLSEFPPFLRRQFPKPKPLKPSAEECYQHALELAPDQLEPYQALLRYYLKQDRPAKAEKMARKLLKRFPEQVSTRETLGDLCLQAQKYVEGIRSFEEAVRANPLERRLRAKLSAAHAFHARALTEEGQFEKARAEFQAALALDESGETYPILCKWAACELKAGEEARAQELLGQALAQTGSDLAVAFSLMIEAIRLKLPRPRKMQFEQDVKRLLAEPPTAAAAVGIADTVAAHRRAGITYHGQKTHEKKVLTYLERARGLTFSEQQLMRICLALEELERVRLLRDYCQRGQEQCPQQPLFYLLEARLNLNSGPFRCPEGRTRQLLKQARQLLLAQPHDERQQAMLEEIAEMENGLGAFNPFVGVFGEEGDEDG